MSANCLPDPFHFSTPHFIHHLSLIWQMLLVYQYRKESFCSLEREKKSSSSSVLLNWDGINNPIIYCYLISHSNSYWQSQLFNYVHKLCRSKIWTEYNRAGLCSTVSGTSTEKAQWLVDRTIYKFSHLHTRAGMILKQLRVCPDSRGKDLESTSQWEECQICSHILKLPWLEAVSS